MRVSSTLASLSATFLIGSAAAQTYSKCNPLEKSGCSPDPALGGTATADFTSGASSDFTVTGDTVSYGSEGASFTISQAGDSPLMVSNWYIMFGRVEVVMKASPGVGIVSSSVLQSDDLDEIDWEWLGADASEVQTNYFGKGILGTYNRGTTVSMPTSQSAFNTYTLDWTAEQTTWEINGQAVRTLTPETAETNQYPQTPMQVKIGSWIAGLPSEAPGTIAWAGGLTNFDDGPFVMVVQSISVTDYSTGKQYSYSGTSGNWESIVAEGGSVYSGNGEDVPTATSSAPAVSGAPEPYTSEPPTTLATSPSVTWTTYPGLPSGWTVTSSGKVVPPSAATTLSSSSFVGGSAPPVTPTPTPTPATTPSFTTQVSSTTVLESPAFAYSTGAAVPMRLPDAGIVGCALFIFTYWLF